MPGLPEGPQHAGGIAGPGARSPGRDLVDADLGGALDPGRGQAQQSVLAQPDGGVIPREITALRAACR